MSIEKKQPKILERKACDNEYLHKDFHGALCYAIKYVDDNYGPEATKEYLQQVAKTFYASLIALLKQQGLQAIEKHYKEIFTKEDGEFTLQYESDTLVLTVDKCPAIAHLKKIDQLFTDCYCETTVVVNKTICSEGGYDFSCCYEPGVGRCIQKFWKPKE